MVTRKPFAIASPTSPSGLLLHNHNDSASSNTPRNSAVRLAFDSVDVKQSATASSSRRNGVWQHWAVRFACTIALTAVVMSAVWWNGARTTTVTTAKLFTVSAEGEGNGLLRRSSGGLLGAVSEETSPKAEENTDLFGGLPLLVQLVLLIFLIGLSGIFCGLTIGVMGLDTISLEIIAEAGQEPDRSYAKELLPMRRLGHQSLATLILGNMLGNVLISQLVADVTPEGADAEIVSFLVATLVILIFAEVIPMSICKSPRALEIAASGVPIMRVFLVLMYPIAKPLGLFLDLITPHDAGQIYDRNELKKLMRIHCDTHGDRSGLDSAELKLLLGAMEFHEATIASIMTPLRDVFMLEAQHLVTYTMLEKLWKEGKSRIPVYKDDPRNIVGILFVKDLLGQLSHVVAHPMVAAPPPVPIGLRTNKNEQLMTVQHLLNNAARDVVRVNVKATLPSVLKMFQGGAPHLLVVEGEYGHFHNLADNVGVVTLEDVIEALIKSEIRDEYDDESSSGDEDVEMPLVDSPTTTLATPTTTTNFGGTGRWRHVPKPPLKMPRVHFSSFYCDGKPLSDDSKWVLAQYLEGTVSAFLGWKLSHIKMLLDDVGDREILVAEEVEASAQNSPQKNVLEMEPSPSMTLDIASSVPVMASSVITSKWFSAKQQHTDASALTTKKGREGHEELLQQVHAAGADESTVSRVLYEYQKPSDVFTLVLFGGVRMFVGQDLFTTEQRSFSMFGEEALVPRAPPQSTVVPMTTGHVESRLGKSFSSDPMNSLPTSGSHGLHTSVSLLSTQQQMNSHATFTPDFTAIVSRSSRILQITRKDYDRVAGSFFIKNKASISAGGGGGGAASRHPRTSSAQADAMKSEAPRRNGDE